MKQYFFTGMNGKMIEMTEPQIKTGFVRWLELQSQGYLEYYRDMLVHHYIFLQLEVEVTDRSERTVKSLVGGIINEFINKNKDVKV